MSNINIFGKQMKKIRENRGITVKQLATAVGLSDSTVWQIENGSRSTTIDNLVKICNILEVNPDYLLSTELNKNIMNVDNDYAKFFQLILELTEGEFNQTYDVVELIIKNRKRYNKR